MPNSESFLEGVSISGRRPSCGGAEQLVRGDSLQKGPKTHHTSAVTGNLLFPPPLVTAPPPKFPPKITTDVELVPLGAEGPSVSGGADTLDGVGATGSGQSRRGAMTFSAAFEMVLRPRKGHSESLAYNLRPYRKRSGYF